MKKIFLYTSLLFALFVSSCKKSEIYEIAVTDVLTFDQVFADAARTEKAVVQGYNGLQNANYLSGRALIYVDIMGGDVYDRQQYFGELPRFNITGTNGFASGVWSAAYGSIGSANRAIRGMAAYPNVLDPATFTHYNAECKFVRAVNHFYLVNFFAQPYAFTTDASHLGVPIITQSFTSVVGSNVPRATVKQVYAQIIKDLTEALADLPAQQADTYTSKSRATKAAASAMLARTYLYMGDYANAKLYSGNILSGLYGNFTLTTAVNGAFGTVAKNQSSETIFSIANSQTDNPGTNNALPMHYASTGRADLVVSKIFLDASQNTYYATDDKRRTMLTGTVSTAVRYTTKYPQTTTIADWAPIVRLPEIYFIYAEATTKATNTVTQDAIDKLNKVRDRARVSAPQYTLASFATSQDLVDAILGERRIELAFEGHRFWDLMRNKKTVTKKLDSDGATIIPDQAYGLPKNIFPIPQDQVDLSKGVLIQNPGY